MIRTHKEQLVGYTNVKDSTNLSERNTKTGTEHGRSGKCHTSKKEKVERGNGERMEELGNKVERTHPTTKPGE